jgi:hypothetical protein
MMCIHGDSPQFFLNSYHIAAHVQGYCLFWWLW